MLVMATWQCGSCWAQTDINFVKLIEDLENQRIQGMKAFQSTLSSAFDLINILE